MPTLFRLIAVLAVLAALVYGAMLALVTFADPPPREIIQPITLPKPTK